MSILQNDIKLIKASGLFDTAWYLGQYADVAGYGLDPVEHYLRYGAQQFHNPGPGFDTQYYCDNNPDIESTLLNPLVHYITIGRREGRVPVPAEGASAAVERRKAPRPAANKVLSAKADGLYFSEHYPTYPHTRHVAVHAVLTSMKDWELVVPALEGISFDFSLYVSVTKELFRQAIDCVRLDFPNAVIIPDDANRDDHALVKAVDSIRREGCTILIHVPPLSATAQGGTGQHSDDWTRLCLGVLSGTANSVNAAIAAFDANPDLGVIGVATLLKSAGAMGVADDVLSGPWMKEIGTIGSAHDWSLFAGSVLMVATEVFSGICESVMPAQPKRTGARQLTSSASAFSPHSVRFDKEGKGENGFAALTGFLVEHGGYATGLLHQLGVDSSNNVIELRKELESVTGRDSLAESFARTAAARPSYKAITQLGIFDANFYSLHEKSAGRLGIDPLYHYLTKAQASGADPAPWFSDIIYRRMYGKQLRPGASPFLHYAMAGKRNGWSIFPSMFDSENIVSTIQRSGLVSADYYLANNADVAQAGADPVRHYCRFGWLEMRKPNKWFDGTWSGNTHLGELADIINPLLHYLLVGQKDGLSTQPPREAQNRTGTGVRYTEKNMPVRRVCLFAGYDADGIVDDYVVDYLGNLSRFADVYYLADCDMQPGELEKLAPCTKGAWAARHGMYDFGSYSLLAKRYVGWDKINGYDELILANDSCYRIGDFAGVLAKMDKKQCDWWGLQATKGIAATARVATNRFQNKISMEVVKASMLSSFEEDYTYDFLVGSYFVCYRKPVLQDQGFRRLLDSVKPERTKKLVVQRYEIGFTKYLINKGFELDTFIDALYPFHPLFSLNHFNLIKEGFPLFKRYLLTDNHYHAPQLHRWKEYLAALAPRADLTTIEANLYRVADYQKLYRNLRISRDAKGVPVFPSMLSDAEMASADPSIPKNDNWWIFPVCGFNHTFSGNERAVFEHVKEDESIKKIILTRSRHVQVTGKNVVVVPLHSPEGQGYLLRSKVVFIKHTPTRNIEYSLSPAHHDFINLWHGIPLKRIGVASLDQQNNLEALQIEHGKCKAVIASSKIDRMAMSSAFYPLTYNDVWVTGLPRNDFVVCEESALPKDMFADMARIRKMLDGRRLVLYAPTFRNGKQASYYSFTRAEKRRLQLLLKKHHCVLGVREHLADKSRSYSRDLKEIGAIDLGDKRFSNIEVIYRLADVLVTDYSSCFIDFMLTEKPMISFAYDYDSYINKERGFFYDMSTVFPGPICKDFESVIKSLDSQLRGIDRHDDQQYQNAKDIFFEFNDAFNAKRVVAQVKSGLTKHNKSSLRALT
jgi:CDP-glycerol glycerophosphotransferase (TagB/SpsB family)